MSMPCIALTDNPALQNLQGGEQGRRSVALVIVRHGPATPLFQRQTGLRAIQGLDLALIIHAQHDRLLRKNKYRPTTSVNFSKNLGSRDSLNVFTRCGLRLWLRQMLLTVDLLTPWLLAISRQLQWVIPFGLLCSVPSTMALIRSGP